MTVVAAAILGIVQGVTEFLPISSSAHLILVPWLLGWEPDTLVFDVALHVGTALAILTYFWREWVLLAREAITGILQGNPFGNTERKLAWLLVVGTIPAMVIGLAFEKKVEQTLRSPLVTVATLIIFGLVIYFSERRSRKNRDLGQITLGDAIFIGISQAVALIPGVSRSGVTISAAMLKDMDRRSAARFSFLLATPVIVGAGLLESRHLVKAIRHPAAAAAENAAISGSDWLVLAVGVTTAAVTGFLCIRYFLRYLQSHTFTPFVIYRFVLAIVVLAMFFRFWTAAV